MDYIFTQTEHFKQLEEKLLQPAIRKSTLELENLIDDDFIEIGSSGRIYSKAQVIEELIKESPGQIIIKDFNCIEINNESVLLRYKAEVIKMGNDNTSYSLRSSIWKLFDGKWKIIFHQGTISAQS